MMSDGYIRPTGRAMMGAVRRWYDHANCTATSSGSPSAQTLNYAVPPTAIVAGDTFCFFVGPGLTNIGSVTLRINESPPRPILLPGGTALTGGELEAGYPVIVTESVSDFQLMTVPATLLKRLDELSERMDKLEARAH